MTRQECIPKEFAASLDIGCVNQPYNLLRHLGKLVFFGTFADSLPVAIFSAYFDASGNKRASVLTVAGFVSEVNKWDRFNNEWSAILSRENVSAMHMTDFVSSQGEFASWRGQTDRRRRFISDLSECIAKTTEQGFASTVVVSDYTEINCRFMLSETVGQPFTFCMRACLGGLAKWAGTAGLNAEEMLVAIEHGDEDQGELIRKARLDGFKVVPLTKSDVMAFQACDLAAWKTRNVVHKATTTSVEIEEDLARIISSLAPIQSIIQDNGGFDGRSLQELCVTEGVRVRQSAAGVDLRPNTS